MKRALSAGAPRSATRLVDEQSAGEKSSSVHLSGGESSASDSEPAAPPPPKRRRRLLRKADVQKPRSPSPSPPPSESEGEESGSESGERSDALFDSHDADGEMDSFIVSDDDSAALSDAGGDAEDDGSDAEGAPPARPRAAPDPAANLTLLAAELADIMPWDASGTAPDVLAARLVSGEAAAATLKRRQTKVEKRAPAPARAGGDATLREEWREFVLETDAARDAEYRAAAARDPRLAHQLRALDAAAHNAVGLFRKPGNKPYFHQLSALAWMMLREMLPYKGLAGGLLCDDMGVGKTLMAQLLIAADRICGYYTPPGSAADDSGEHKFRPPTLVCCPNMLLGQWLKERDHRFDQRRLSMIVLHDTHTPGWRNTLSAETMAETDVLVINYEGLGNIYKELRDELLTDIRLHPRRYRQWLNETPDGADAAGDDDDDDLAAAAADADGDAAMADAEPAGGDAPKRSAELDRKAKRLVDENLQVGFHTLWQDTKKWKAKHFIYGWAFRRLILDECTQVKNDETLRFASVRALQAQRRWGISGTPVENNIDELYSQLTVLGIAREAHSIRDKRRWHRFVASGAAASASSLLVPDAAVVARLKRRFLNVITLRREIQNINAVNPLAPFVKRALCAPAESAAWDAFVSARTTTKRERAIRRHHRQRARQSAAAAIRYDVHDEAWWQSGLGDLTRDQLKRAEPSAAPGASAGDHAARQALAEAIAAHPAAAPAPAFLQGVPDGFYWYTSQRQFAAAYRHVDSWLQEMFNLDLGTIHGANEAARAYMRAHHIVVPTTPADAAGIRAAILGVIQQSALDPSEEPPVDVLGNFPVPIPLLFAAECHPLEAAVYKDGLSIARQLVVHEEAAAAGPPAANAGREAQTNHNVAFRCITQCRTACLDYRSARNAPGFLTLQRGTAWDADGREPVEMIDYEEIVNDEAEATEDDEINILKAAEAREAALEAGAQPARGKATATTVKRAVAMPARAPTKYLMYLRYVQAAPAGDKLILFTEYVSYLPRLRRFFEANGVRTITIVGGMNGKVRDDIVAKFHETGAAAPRLLLASLRCVNMGINLQCANHVLQNPNWNGAVEEQAKRRTLRMGQEKEVYFVYFVFLKTIEELVLSRGGEKSAMITTVVGTDDGLVKTGSNFTRPDVSQARFMEFAQGAYGPVAPDSPAARLWLERTMADLAALPTVRLGTTFERITTASLLSDKGSFDHTKVARALYTS